MKQKLAYYEVESRPKNELSLYLSSHFIAMYRNILCRYCRLWSFFESPQLKNRFFEVKRLCQRIKHRIKHFVVCISLWQFQNRYKEMDVIKSLFNRYNACHLHRVTHDYGEWQKLSMVRSSRPDVFCEKGVLRNFAKFPGKHLCQSVFFNKVAGSACNFIKEETLAQAFTFEFCEIYKNTFFTDQLWWLNCWAERLNCKWCKT